MLGGSRKFVLIAATLVAILAMLPLPAALTAETEPRPADIAPAKASGVERAPEKDGKTQKSAREKVTGSKLVIEKPAPQQEPPPKPAPKEEPAPEKPAPKPAPEPEEDREPLVSAGAKRVPVLPGPSSKAPEKPPAAPPAAEKKEVSGNQLLLTAPRLGLEDVTVGDSPKQAYLDQEGIMHLSGTGFPRKRGSNTYIAGHAADYDASRVPNVFRNLHTIRQGDLITLRDSAGKTYNYRVYERFVVDPRDVWVTKPVPGKQVVSLQTCFPAPTFERRLIVRGQLVS